MVLKPTRLFTEVNRLSSLSRMLIVILYRFCGPRPRGHHNSYAEGSKMTVPVMLSLVVVRFVSNPVETVSLEVDSKISYFRLAPSGTPPKRSKLAFRSQGAPWSGGRLFSWPSLDMSISEFRIYTSDEPLVEEKSWMTYAGCQIPILCQYLKRSRIWIASYQLERRQGPWKWPGKLLNLKNYLPMKIENSPIPPIKVVVKRWYLCGCGIFTHPKSDPSLDSC